MNKNEKVMVMEVHSTFVWQTKMFEPQVKAQVASGWALTLAVHNAECVLLFLIVNEKAQHSFYNAQPDLSEYSTHQTTIVICLVYFFPYNCFFLVRCL